MIANAQVMVANAIHDNILPVDNHRLQTGEQSLFSLHIQISNYVCDLSHTTSIKLITEVNTISKSIVDWASSGNDTFMPAFRCNGDSMVSLQKSKWLGNY